MLKKIEDKKIMTVREAREKYSNNHIGMKITKRELLTTTDEDECIVMYIVDSYRERYKIPTWEEKLVIFGGYGVTDVPGGSIRVTDEIVGDE